MTKKIFIIAGEASGDLIGAKLIKQLRAKQPNLQITGIGGEQMQTQNIQSLFDIRQISLMGFLEVLPHAGKLLKLLNYTAQHIRDLNPDMVITIDSPGFNKRVVKRLQAMRPNTKFLHIVAPTVWAYRPKRAKTFAKIFDHLFCLFPFEPKYFKAENLPTTFIGHHLLEDGIDKVDGSKFRDKYKIPIDKKLLCVMAGSRRGEVTKLLPELVPALNQLHKKHNIHVAMPTTKYVEEFLQDQLKQYNCKFNYIITPNDKYSLFKASDVGIIKSGTASLEAAIATLPMIIIYKANSITAWLIRRMIKIKYAGLINIIAGKQIVPELIQDDCNTVNIVAQIDNLLKGKTIRESQKQQMADNISKLQTANSPSATAADKVLELL